MAIGAIAGQRQREFRWLRTPQAMNRPQHQRAGDVEKEHGRSRHGDPVRPAAVPFADRQPAIDAGEAGEEQHDVERRAPPQIAGAKHPDRYQRIAGGEHQQRPDCRRKRRHAKQADAGDGESHYGDGIEDMRHEVVPEQGGVQPAPQRQHARARDRDRSRAGRMRVASPVCRDAWQTSSAVVHSESRAVFKRAQTRTTRPAPLGKTHAVAQ